MNDMNHISSSSKIRELTATPNHSQLTGLVDKTLIDSLVISGGISKEKLITNIKQLFPIEAGMSLLYENGWEKLESKNPSADIFEIKGENGEKQFVKFQYVNNNFAAITTLVIRTQREGQEIIMSPNGQVIRDSGKYRTS